MLRLVEALASRGWIVHYVGVAAPRVSGPSVRFYQVEQPEAGSPSLWVLARCLWRAARVCWKARVKLVWSFGAAYAAFLMPLRLLPGRLLLTFLRGSLVEQERAKGSGRGRILLARLVEGLSSRVSHVTVAVSRDLARRGGSDVRVLPNNVEPPSVVPEREAARRKWGLPSHAFLVGYAGAIVPIKSLETLVSAAVRLPEIHVALMGFSGEESPYEGHMRRLVDARNVSNRVHLLRWSPEVNHLVAAADVVVLPSRHEGCPNLLLEAMSLGQACLGARAGGIPEVLLHEDLMFAPEDASGLAERLRELMENPEQLRRARELCRDRAASFHFDWEERATQLFEEVLMRSRVARASRSGADL